MKRDGLLDCCYGYSIHGSSITLMDSGTDGYVRYILMFLNLIQSYYIHTHTCLSVWMDGWTLFFDFTPSLAVDPLSQKVTELENMRKNTVKEREQ